MLFLSKRLLTRAGKFEELERLDNLSLHPRDLMRLTTRKFKKLRKLAKKAERLHPFERILAEEQYYEECRRELHKQLPEANKYTS